MSKVLLLNGSPHEKGCTYTALSEVGKTLEKNGVEVEYFHIGNKPVPGCTACGFCVKSGKCIFSDGVNEIAEKLDSFSAVVIGSPVYYASASGQLCSFLDRLFYSTGKKMENKFGSAVVSCRRGGASSALDRINKYFGISNMHIVGSQYWNMVHGNTPEEVRKDEEGMQTMRTLGENLAYLIKAVDAGGITPPAHEKRTATNFIR